MKLDVMDSDHVSMIVALGIGIARFSCRSGRIASTLWTQRAPGL